MTNFYELSKFSSQLHVRLLRKAQSAFIGWFAVDNKSTQVPLHCRKANSGGPFSGRGIIQDEVQELRRKFLRISGIEEIQIYQHQFPILDLPQPFKHQIHPERFAGAIDLDRKSVV